MKISTLQKIGYRAIDELKEEGKFIFFFNFYTDHLEWLKNANTGCILDLNFRLDAPALAQLGKPEVTRRLVFFYGRAIVLIENYAPQEEQRLLVQELDKKIEELKCIEDIIKEL